MMKSCMRMNARKEIITGGCGSADSHFKKGSEELVGDDHPTMAVEVEVGMYPGGEGCSIHGDGDG